MTELKAMMPGYRMVGSDKYPVTVMDVSPSLRFIITRDVRVVTWEPHPICTGIAFEEDLNGTVRRFSLRKGGTYYEVGSSDCRLVLGRHVAFSDPHL